MVSVLRKISREQRENPWDHQGRRRRKDSLEQTMRSALHDGTFPGRSEKREGHPSEIMKKNISCRRNRHKKQKKRLKRIVGDQ